MSTAETVPSAQQRSFMHELGLSEQEIAQRKAFLTFNDEDVQRLHALHELGQRYADGVIDDFYGHLQGFAESRRFFTDPAILMRVKAAQKQYFLQLTQGPYDIGYVEDRLRIGITHERINLPFELYLGAYNFYLRAVLQRVVEAYKNTPEQVTPTLTSILKLIFLDIGLAIETYLSQRERTIREQQSRIQQMNNNLERQIAARTEELVETNQALRHEIIQRQRAEAALRASEERFRNAFNHAPIGVALLAPDGRWLEVNHALCAMLGYSEEVLSQTTYQALTHPDDIAADQTNVQRLLVGGVSSYQREKRYLHNEGHVVWALVSVSLVRDAAGHPQYLIAQIQDISARKQTEVALRESEEQFRTLSTTAPIGIFVCAANWDCTYTNPRWQKIAGLTLEQSLGQGWLQAVHPDDRPRVVQTWKTSQSDQQDFVCEFRMIRPSGEVCWVELRAAERRGNTGMQIVYVGTTEDITERRRAETWVTRLTETTQDAVIAIDRQGRIVLFNRAAEQMFGYTPQEVERQPVRLLMPEPYAGEHDGYVERYERTGEARAVGRVRVVSARRKNGEVFPMELSVTEIDSNDEVRYAAFIRDISERVQLHERLVDRERLAAIGTTAAKLVHEVGNPLNSMSMATQLLQRRLEKQREVLDDKVFSSVQSLRGEIARLAKLLQEFRSLSRNQQVTLQPTDVRTVVCEVLAAELPYYTTHGVVVDQILPTGLPPVHADADKLKQVVLNLCQNAVEAMPDGGTLAVRVHNSHAHVIIEVADTGAGIPDGVNVFEPFVTTKAEGTGLGLPIVRQIIEAHRGRLTYTTTPGQGTTFIVQLPVAGE